MVERHVVLDPYIVAVPAEATEAEAYVSGLVTWLPVLGKRRHEASFFESALLILLQQDRFPTHTTLSLLLSRADASEYSVVDLLQMVGVLAATEPFFEQFVGRRAAVASNASIEPQIVIDRLGEELGNATRDALVLAAVACESGWCPEGTRWATRDWTSDQDWIAVNADVSLVELINGDLKELDQSVSAVIRVLTDPDEVEFGGTIAETYQNPELAVGLVLHQLRQFDTRIPAAVDVRTGAGFITSLETLGLQHNEAILETIFHRATLASIGKLSSLTGAKLHPVRTGKAADAPQMTREDGAKLWRCMVTKTGAGYRLHYWSLKDGGIELDAVLVESDV